MTNTNKLKTMTAKQLNEVLTNPASNTQLVIQLLLPSTLTEQQAAQLEGALQLDKPAFEELYDNPFLGLHLEDSPLQDLGNLAMFIINHNAMGADTKSEYVKTFLEILDNFDMGKLRQFETDRLAYNDLKFALDDNKTLINGLLAQRNARINAIKGMNDRQLIMAIIKAEHQQDTDYLAELMTEDERRNAEVEAAKLAAEEAHPAIITHWHGDYSPYQNNNVAAQPVPAVSTYQEHAAMKYEDGTQAPSGDSLAHLLGR